MSYTILGPVLPLLRLAFRNSILTTEELGRAMIAVARSGAPKSVLESKDILALATMDGAGAGTH